MGTEQEDFFKLLGEAVKSTATPPRDIVRFWGVDTPDPVEEPGGRVAEVRPALFGFVNLAMHESGEWLQGHDPETGQQVVVHLLDDVKWISIDRHPDSAEDRTVTE